MLRTVWGDDARFRNTYFGEIEGVYFTGDGARRDEDGYFWIVGRIDDVVNVAGHRLGTAEIESALVSHKAVTVNGQVVNIPSFSVKAGDVIALREKAKTQLRVQDALKLAQSVGLCDWVQVDATKMEGTFKKVPDRDQFGAEIKEALIVELYSR